MLTIAALVGILLLINVAIPWRLLSKSEKTLTYGLWVSFSLVAWAITGWQSSLILVFLGDLAEAYDILWVTAAFSFALLLIIGLYILSFYYPDEQDDINRKELIYHGILLLAQCAVAIVTIFSGEVVKDYVNNVVVFGKYGAIYQIVVVISLLSVLALFIRRFRKEVQSQEYYKYLIVMLVVLIPLATLFNFILPLFGFTDFVLQGAFVFSVITPFIAYTLAQKRLYTYRYILQKASYIFSVAVILYALFYGTEFINVKLYSGLHSVNSYILNALIAFIVAILLGPAFDRIFAYLQRVVLATPSVEDQVDDILLEFNSISKLAGVGGILRNLTEIHYRAEASVQILSLNQYLSQVKREKTKTRIRTLVRERPIITNDDLRNERYGSELPDVLIVMMLQRRENENHLLAVVKTKDAYKLNITREYFDILAQIRPNIEIVIQRNTLYERTAAFAESLSKKVKERTQEIEVAKEKIEAKNVQLGMVLSELKTLDKAKSDFISMASHQLRTPISIARGYLAMLQEGDFGELNLGQLEPVAKTMSSLTQLNTIVEDILNATRIEQGRLVLNFEVVDLAKLARRAAETLEPKADKKSLNMVFRSLIPEGKTMYSVDANKLYEVLYNIIDNAINYTPAGKIQIIVELHQDEFQFSVKDSGIGIPADQQKSMFQRFTRGRNAMSVRPDGSGIGLFLAKTIVNAHHGKIWFESTENVGTTFFITIPRSKKTGTEQIKIT